MSGSWKAYLGPVLVFVLGCLAGTLVTSLFFTHRATNLLAQGPGAYMQMVERRLTRHLDLDPTQKEQIHEDFMQNLEERKKTLAQLQPEIHAINGKTMQAIRSVLRPEQLEQFHQNMLEYRERFGRGPFNARALEKEDAPSIAPAAAPPTTNATP